MDIDARRRGVREAVKFSKDAVAKSLFRGMGYVATQRQRSIRGSDGRWLRGFHERCEAFLIHDASKYAE